MACCAVVYRRSPERAHLCRQSGRWSPEAAGKMGVTALGHRAALRDDENPKLGCGNICIIL